MTRMASERGSTLVLSALLMTALLGMAAIVLDLAALRQDRADNRSTADASAMAAALTLAAEGGTMAQACTDAWAYFLDNSPGVPGAPPPCAMAFQEACDPAIPRAPAVGTAGDLTLSITNPVLDSDPLMQPDAIGSVTQPANPAVDGSACERIGVQITETQDTFFAGVLGVDRSSTTSHSVARSDVGATESGVLALLLLEEEACNVIYASGQAKVIVKPNGDKPGYITVDSSATGGSGSSSCTSGTRYALEVADNGNAGIEVWPSETSGAAGVIRQFALAPGQGNARAYDPADVSTGRLDPEPTIAYRRMGRSPVDHRYNCTASGHDGIAGNADDCQSSAARPPHLDALRAALGGTGVPDGYQVFPRPDTSDSCAPSASIVVPAGDWFVDCVEFSPNAQVVFSGGNVVTRGPVHVQGGSLTINGDAAGDGVLYVRSGGLSKVAQAAMSIRRTAVFLAGGALDLKGGSGSLNWVAPVAGPFEDLAFWSESAALHGMGGQSNINVEGVFFMPNADPFEFSGQGGQNQANAQFITRRLVVSGQGELVMSVTPERAVLTLVRGARLIR